MLELVSKKQASENVIHMINDLSSKFSYYELSIHLEVNEKTIYKWRSGSVPKADKYLSLEHLHDYYVRHLA